MTRTSLFDAEAIARVLGAEFVVIEGPSVTMRIDDGAPTRGCAGARRL